DRIKEYAIGSVVLHSETPQSRMIRLGKNAANGLETISIDEIIERYRVVTRADIQRVAERVLSQQPTIAVISPLEQEQVEEALAL
ncbi:MAG: hypothetical protein LBD25_05330, partial [Coriobacteriales bacterium]|nr:hypothetical protein [Coriobacteriales bacterium]